MFTLSHWLKASHVSFHFHLIHGHAHWCLIVLFFLVPFYFLLDFTFLLFVLLSMTDRDSMNFNPLCHFANGSFVTLDDCMPDTRIGEIPVEKNSKEDLQCTPTMRTQGTEAFWNRKMGYKAGDIFSGAASFPDVLQRQLLQQLVM